MKNYLNIMVEDIGLHMIGMTDTDIADAELKLTGYVMFRSD